MSKDNEICRKCGDRTILFADNLCIKCDEEIVYKNHKANTGAVRFFSLLIFAAVIYALVYLF